MNETQGTEQTEIAKTAGDSPHPVDPSAASTANIVYILYLVGLVVGITGLVGVVMAYMNRSGAPEWVQTHYRWQIRTFWIGLLFSVVGGILAMVVIGLFILLFTLIWFIVRTVKGMQLLGKQEPVPNVDSWLFG